MSGDSRLCTPFIGRIRKGLQRNLYSGRVVEDKGFGESFPWREWGRNRELGALARKNYSERSCSWD